MSPDEVARVFRRVVSWGRSSNVFLAVGPGCTSMGQSPRVRHARVRLDPRPGHPRQGGERILEQLLVAASRQLREGIRGSVYLFKNNTDSAGNSYGCHENYLTSRRTTWGTTPRC